MKPFTKSLSALAASALMVCAAHGASIVIGDAYILASQNHSSNTNGEGVRYFISVNSTNSGFAGQFNRTSANVDGTPFQVNFTQPVQAYRFATNGTANTITTRAGSTGSDTAITMTTTDTAFDSFGQGGGRLWTTTNPGTDLLTAASPNFSGNFGLRDISNVSGSVDISGLSSGTVWFFYGGYNSTPTISGTMVDIDGPSADLLVANAHVGDAANRQEMYVASFNFVNDAGYDSINYAYGVGTRWAGIVVTGTAIPEPRALLLSSLGILLLLRRRR